MTIYSFDWSGADVHSKRSSTIACYAGSASTTPALACPLGNRTMNWSRLLVYSQLECLASSAAANRERVVVGFDFPLSFPWVNAGYHFPGGHPNRSTFWQHVHQVVWPNGTAQDFVDRYSNLFAQNRNKGANYTNHLRCTEDAARQNKAPAKGVFNLRGVSPGKGAISGIAMLQELLEHCTQRHLPLMIWPFFQLLADGSVNGIDTAQPLRHMPDGCLAIVETYPKVSWVRSRQQRASYNRPATWAAVQGCFNNTSNPPLLPRDEDQADALVAWYGLAEAINLAGALAAGPSIQPVAIQQEGWIYGV